MTRHIELLRASVKSVRQRHSFTIHGWVVLPEHLHCVIELPPGDSDYATRWRLIKMDFSKALPHTERISDVRLRRGERGIWQRRYWEHLIQDERDYAAHMDYVHINPVKHGLVRSVAGWPFQPFTVWSRKEFTQRIGREGMRWAWDMTIKCGAMSVGYCTLHILETKARHISPLN